MYNIPVTLDGLYEEVNNPKENPGGFWGLHNAKAFYIGNGQYYTCLHLKVYLSDEIDLIWILVKRLGNHSEMTKV